MNIGHQLTLDHLILRPRRGLVVLRGACGERLHIAAKDWPEIRKRMNKAVRQSLAISKEDDSITTIAKTAQEQKK